MTNDDFLYERRATPRPEFVESLRGQLGQVRPAQSRIRRIALPVLKTAAAISLMTFVILAISPETRAYVSKVVQNAIEYLHFGNVQLNVVPRISGGGQSGQPADHETVTLAEAQTRYAFKIPAWLPNDWPQVDEAEIITFEKDSVFVALYYPEKPSETEAAQLTFTMLTQKSPVLVVGNTHHARQVMINGHEGTLYVGSWTNGEFGGDEKNLVWTMDDRTYYLTSRVLSDDDLIKIAESVK